MIKHIISSFFLLVCLNTITAQNDFLDFESIENSSIQASPGNAVLIVPFSSNMYNNQESEYIIRKSGLTYEQTINYFKSSLDSSIIAALDDSCKVISMLNSFTSSTSSDIERLHGAAKYYQAERKPIESKEKYSMFEKNDPKKNNVTERNKNIQGGEIVSVKQTNENAFISVKFDDKILLNSMAMKYGAKYILFVTEFGLMGDFSDPYKVAKKTYNRIIKVHYALFTSEGDFVSGNRVDQAFPAYDDLISSICNTNFPVLAQSLAKDVPKK